MMLKFEEVKLVPEITESQFTTIFAEKAIIFSHFFLSSFVVPFPHFCSGEEKIKMIAF